MTTDEYIDKLREAIATSIAAYEQPPRNSADLEQRRLANYGLLKAYALPRPAAQKLRPMADAPRDGKPILVKHKRGYWLQVSFDCDDAEWCWRFDTSTFTQLAFTGWLPLPEVEA